MNKLNKKLTKRRIKRFLLMSFFGTICFMVGCSKSSSTHNYEDNSKTDTTSTSQAIKDDSWFYQHELERAQYNPKTYEHENISGIMTVPQVWEGTRELIENDPLEEDILRAWVSDGIEYKEIYFTSRTISDGKVRIYAIYGVQENSTDLPAVLHIHGGGQTVNESWVAYWAKRGYAALSINWGGRWDGRTEYARYPESVRHGNHLEANHDLASPDVRNNSWYEWTYANRRALTYLENQPEVNGEKIGIFGISMGGTLSWMVAASDDRVKASVPIYGAGYDYGYRNNFLYAGDEYTPTGRDDVKRYITGISPQASAQYISAPILFLSATHDFHGDMDWAGKTYDALPPDTIRRISYSPNFSHHIYKGQEQNLPLWMDAHLKGEGIFPKNPTLQIKKGQSGDAELELNVDITKEIESVELYYGLETLNAMARYWKPVEAIFQGDGRYIAQVEFMNADKYLFAYASVIYKDGYHLSTTVSAVKPEDIECTTPTAVRTDILYAADEGISGWGFDGLGTDPIPVSGISYFPLQARETPNDGMMVITERISPWTYRLSDPRFAPPSPGAKLKFTFHTTLLTNITVGARNAPYTPVGYDPYTYTEQISKSNSSILIGLDDLKLNGNSRSDWSDFTTLVLVNLKPTVRILSIEWVE